MRHAILPALSLLALLSLTGCAGSVHEGVNMKNKVAFGAVVPNTGPYRLLGSEYYRGMIVAESTLNASGGVNDRQVKVLVYDSVGEPEKGLDATRRLVRDFEAPYIAVALPRVVDKAAGEVAKSDGVLLRLDAGHAPDTTGDSLRAFVDAADEAALMGDTAKEASWKRVLILAVEDRYGEDAATRAAAAITAAGATRVDRLPLNRESTTAQAIRDAAGGTAYDAVCIFAHGPEIAPALLALKQAASKAVIVGNHAFAGKSVTMLAPTLLQGVRYTAPDFVTKPDRPMANRFREEYRALNGAEPDLFSAFGYDQVMLIFTAAKDEETVSPRVVRRHILAGKTYEGAAGTYRFDEQGDAHLELTLSPVITGPTVRLTTLSAI